MSNTSTISKAAAKLGSITTEAKAKASRANGALGGRPVRAFIGVGGYKCEVVKSPVKPRVWGVHLPTRSGQGDYTWHEFSSRKAAVAFCEDQADFAGWSV